MEIIHADTYEEARALAQKHKATPAGAGMCHKIVEGRYRGWSVVVIEPELLTDMLLGDIPAIPELRDKVVKMPFSPLGF